MSSVHQHDKQLEVHSGYNVDPIMKCDCVTTDNHEATWSAQA